MEKFVLILKPLRRNNFNSFVHTNILKIWDVGIRKHSAEIYLLSNNYTFAKWDFSLWRFIRKCLHVPSKMHKLLKCTISFQFNSERVVSVWADGTIGHREENTAQKAPMSPFMSAPTPKSTPKQVHEMGSSNSFIIKMSRGQKVYCLLPANQVLAGLGFSSFSGHLLRVTSD